MKISIGIFLICCVNFLFAQDYEKLKTNIQKLHLDLNQKYQKADSTQKDSLITTTKAILFDKLTKEIISSWYGTKWDYNGTTETPKEGAIACGYFVTTTLRDLGFDLNRYKYAQMASESMILKFTSQVKRFSEVEDDVLLNYFEKFPSGIFIVGLDSHTGYIVKDKSGILFIHAVKYEDLDGVVKQDLKEEDNLALLSSYKVVGEILTDEMVRKWLEGEKYE